MRVKVGGNRRGLTAKGSALFPSCYFPIYHNTSIFFNWKRLKNDGFFFWGGRRRGETAGCEGGRGLEEDGVVPRG